MKNENDQSATPQKSQGVDSDLRTKSYTKPELLYISYAESKGKSMPLLAENDYGMNPVGAAS